MSNVDAQVKQITQSSCAMCGELWRLHASGGQCPSPHTYGDDGTIRYWEAGEDLWAAYNQSFDGVTLINEFLGSGLGKR